MECVRLRVKDIDFGTATSSFGMAKACVIASRFCPNACAVRFSYISKESRSCASGISGRAAAALPSPCSATQISERRAFMGMAICLPSGQGFDRPSLTRNPPSSYRGEKSPERCETGGPARGRCKGCELSHVPAQLRHTFAGKRLRHPLVQELLGHKDVYDDDLHPRVEQTRTVHPQPIGRGTAKPPKSSHFPVRRKNFV